MKKTIKPANPITGLDIVKKLGQESDALKLKINKFLEKGKESEIHLLNLLIRDGFNCDLSAEWQDYSEHWDIITMIDKTLTRIDVKGLKQLTADGRTWIELKNVNGDIGWLYASKLHTIAFEKNNSFVFVRRTDLIPIVEEGIKRYEEINGHGLCFDKNVLEDYQRYSRVNFGRSDEVIKIPFSDFEHIIYKTIYK
jgi:hypothetical protein